MRYDTKLVWPPLFYRNLNCLPLRSVHIDGINNQRALELRVPKVYYKRRVSQPKPHSPVYTRNQSWKPHKIEYGVGRQEIIELQISLNPILCFERVAVPWRSVPRTSRLSFAEWCFLVTSLPAWPVPWTATWSLSALYLLVLRAFLMIFVE